MTVWYELTPVDTLFFRGAEPMEAGQAASVPLSPPPVSVVMGAIRTAVLQDQGISFVDYKQGIIPAEILGRIGKCGEDAPFSVTAFLMRHLGCFYAPAPASWYIDADEKPMSGQDFIGMHVVTATTTDEAVRSMGIVSSAGEVSLVVTRHEAIPLSGCWINVRLLSQPDVIFAEGDVLTEGELFAVENRIGIGLNNNRVVEEGKLFSANHVRLKDGVSIVVALDSNPGLAITGMIQLGGEQRKCHYEQLTGPPAITPASDAKGFVALAPVPAEEERMRWVISSHRLMQTAGWDLSRGFHKPTQSWFPAGAVFSEKISDSCIPLALI